MTSLAHHGNSNRRQFHSLHNEMLKLTKKENHNSTSLAYHEGNPPATGGFPSQRATYEKNPFHDIIMGDESFQFDATNTKYCAYNIETYELSKNTIPRR